MATSRAKKSTTTTKVKATDEAPNVVTVEPVEDVKPTNLVPTEIDPHQYVTVVNGYQGKLVYTSPRTGETFVWGEFGDEQEMELIELRTVKNSAKKFFTANWFMFNDEDSWVIDYLGMRQYYNCAINIDQFEELFSMSAAEIAKVVPPLSDGQKRSISYLARKKIADEEIDSIKTVRALEKALGVNLTER